MSGRRGFSKRIGDTLWLHFEGRTFTVEDAGQTDFPKSAGAAGSSGVSFAANGRRASAKIASGLLKSPMPGKVSKVNFKVGDVVGQGQTVCVIEAMKMEYALKAPFAGTIKEILKSAGDSIALDEKIAQLDKIPDAPKS